MEKTIFKKNKFTSAALELFQMAQNIAAQLNCDRVCCSHFLAALLRLTPGVVTDVLNKDISSWLTGLNLDYALLDASNKKVPLADELNVLLLDDSEDLPLYFIKNIFENRILGPAELAFIILKEPTEEISEILVQHNTDNNLINYEEQICNNYLACCEKHTGLSARDRLNQYLKTGKTFSAFMNQRIVGQEKAVEAISSALINFRHKGNQGKPLAILLISRSGGGASYFARTVQEAFIELGFQKEVTPVMDMNCFLHREAVEAELLGEDKTYRAAHPGQLYSLTRNNRRGAIVFENIQAGGNSARRILSSLIQNAAYDKFFQKNLKLPFNILLCTLTLPESQHDFLLKNCKELDGKKLLDIFNKSREDNNTADLSVLTAMQEFIVLEDLSPDTLGKIAENKLLDIADELRNEYDISFDVTAKEDIINLFLQSTPSKLTPKELTEIMAKHFDGIPEAAIKYPDTRRISITCESLPVYQHEAERRTVRGDYLTFSKEEKYENGVCTISFRNIKYNTQESIDCGTFRIERPKNVSLNEIVGLDNVISEFKEAMDYIKGKFDPSLPPPACNFLLEGPPGCGKTCTMTAIANACDVPVFFATSSAYASAKTINDLFYKAKAMAPCLLLLDEINSIGSASQAWRVDAVNALLTQLDGFEKSPPMIIVGSTNYASQIEPGLLRNGRLSRIVHVGFPEENAREQFIRNFETKYAFELSSAARAHLISLTAGRNVVDLKATLEHALRTSFKNGTIPDRAQLEASFNHISRNSSSSSALIGFNGDYER